MFGVILLGLLVIPLAELWIILAVARRIGGAWTVVVLLGVSLAGAWLLKQQGTRAWSRFRRSLAEGRMPSRELTDGLLIVVGGALLLTPGFLTDAFGLALLFPPTRNAAKRLVRRRVRRRVTRSPSGRVTVDAEVVDVRRDESSPTTGRAIASSEGRSSDEGGSPDRG